MAYSCGCIPSDSIKKRQYLTLLSTLLRRARTALTSLAAIVLFSSCGGGSGEGLDQSGRPISETPPIDTTNSTVDFKFLQDTVLTPVCTVCHAGGGAPVGLRLDSANAFAMLVGVPSLQAPALVRVAPGDPDNSYLIQKLEGTAAIGVQMPLGGPPLATDTINLVRQWISAGALPADQSIPPQLSPTVVFVSPADGASLAASPDSVSAVFSQDMDASLVSDVTFTLSASGGDGTFDDGNETLVAADSIEIPNRQTISLTFTLTALSDEVYEARLVGSGTTALANTGGVVLDGDADGTAGGDFLWRFTVDAAQEAPVPTWRWIQDNVFTPVCVQCHVSGGTAAFLELDEANSFASTVNVPSNGVPTLNLLEPGNPDASYLIQKLEGTAVAGSQMPLGLAPLDINIIAAIRTWVANGVLLEPGDPMPDINKPVVTIQTLVSPVVGVITLSADVTDDVAVTQVRFFVDGTLLGADELVPFEVTWDSTLNTNGLHTLTVEADDAAGNLGVSDLLEVTVDNPPPPDTEAPTVSVTNPGSPLSGVITLSATASDNVGVTQVRLLVDGVLVGAGATPPYFVEWDSTTVADGLVSLTAEADDAAGNSGVSESVEITVTNTPEPEATWRWIQDNIFTTQCVGCHVSGGIAGFLPLTEEVSFSQLVNAETTEGGPQFRVLAGDPDISSLVQRLEGTLTPQMPRGGLPLPDAEIQAVRQWILDGAFPEPTADVTAPDVSLVSPGATVTGTVNLVANANDDSGVTAVRFFVDGVLLDTDITSPYTTQWDTTTVSNDTHVVTAEADDAAGNTGVATSLTVTVDNTIPPDTDAPVLSVTSPGSPVSGVLNIAISASDNVGVTTVRLFVDGNLVGTDVTVPYAIEWDSTTVADGDHTITVEADDAAGNVGAAAPLTVTVDNSPPPDTELPLVNLVSPGSPLSGLVNLSATATDNTGVTEVRFYVDDILLNTDTSAPFGAAWDTTSVSNDLHTLSAEADDAAGNTGTSAALTVAVDNGPPPDTQAPVVTVIDPESPQSGVVSVSVSATDNVGVSTVRLFVDGNLIGTDATAPYVIDWDSTTVADGTYSLTAEADDAAFNTGVSAGVQLLITNVMGPQPTWRWIQDNIFTPQCIVCHVDGGFASFMPLTEDVSYAQLVNAASTAAGPPFRVLPGDPDNSMLVQRIEGTLPPSMPLFGNLLMTDEIQAVRQWILDGAPPEPTANVALPIENLVSPEATVVGRFPDLTEL